MRYLVGYFWQLCLLRASPAHAPASWQFTCFIFSLYVLSSSSLLLIAGADTQVLRSTAIVVSGIVTQLACTWLLLLLKNVTVRFPATLVSLLGTNSLLVICLIPLNLLLKIADQELIKLIVETLYWMFFLWWIGIAGYILHKASEISFLQGAALAFTFEIISLITTRFLLPTQVIN